MPYTRRVSKQVEYRHVFHDEGHQSSLGDGCYRCRRPGETRSTSGMFKRPSHKGTRLAGRFTDEHRDPAAGMGIQGRNPLSWPLLGVLACKPICSGSIKSEGRLVQFRETGMPRLMQLRELCREFHCKTYGTTSYRCWAVSVPAIPTQKPLALWSASSRRPATRETCRVLDPFCGCATALVAADKVDRRWVGIDLSSPRPSSW